MIDLMQLEGEGGKSTGVYQASVHVEGWPWWLRLGFVSKDGSRWRIEWSGPFDWYDQPRVAPQPTRKALLAAMEAGLREAGAMLR